MKPHLGDRRGSSPGRYLRWRFGESDRRPLTRVIPSSPAQTANWSRPLRRRAARTARPARVRIRSRKPCTLARRRLFGWNVRLLTGTPGRSGGCFQIKSGHATRAASRSPDISQGSTAEATWVSLLTVRGILLKVKLNPQHRDFHNVSASDDLGCGKLWFAVGFRGLATRHRVGKPQCIALHTLWMNLWTTSCVCDRYGRTDGDSKQGKTVRRGERIGE